MTHRNRSYRNNFRNEMRCAAYAAAMVGSFAQKNVSPLRALCSKALHIVRVVFRTDVSTTCAHVLRGGTLMR